MTTDDRTISTSVSNPTETATQNIRDGSDPTLKEVLALEAT
jgi:hypothetical protein